uniref:CCCP-1 (inferred by orthology to a C. elegans protein) n=1 Tax=Anisakis simplex TaxID=6269 RepID=A0A0M3IYT2_ANISI
LSKISTLYEKYNIQCAEIERLEKQNSNYREQLLKTIRERETAEDALRNYKNEKSSKFDELERKLLEHEYQLKASKDRGAAQEAHHAKNLAETTAKFNSQIANLLKKCETAEKEKNDAVVRYATRETEVMHLKSELEKIEIEKESLNIEKDTLIQSTKYQRLQEYKQTIETIRKEYESEKIARQQQEETLSITTKRLEAVQTVMSELRSMLEQSQKQLALETEQKLSIKNEHEKLLQQMDNESVKVELAMALSENRELRDQLSIEREWHENAANELSALRDIKSQVARSQQEAEESRREALEATEEREQAEQEASECRKQTERMLSITEQLTDKNSSLSSECDSLRAKNLAINTKFIELEADLRRTKEAFDETQKQLDYIKVTSTAEIASLREDLNSKIAKVQELSRLLDEVSNEKEILKKKHASNIKELRAELMIFRRAQQQHQTTTSATTNHCDTPHENHELTAYLPITNGGCSSSSRASSICSMETSTRNTLNAPSPVDEASNMNINASLPSSSSINSMQQQMIEKIVKLQRQLARKQDKVEFLEEHVRQCTEELRKKTKIIQNYALREEASLLLPESDSLTQVNSVFESFKSVSTIL